MLCFLLFEYLLPGVSVPLTFVLSTSRWHVKIKSSDLGVLRYCDSSVPQKIKPMNDWGNFLLLFSCAAHICQSVSGPFTCIRLVLTRKGRFESFEHTHSYLTPDLWPPYSSTHTCPQGEIPACSAVRVLSDRNQKVETQKTKTSQRTSGRFNLSLAPLRSQYGAWVKSESAIRELKVLIMKGAGCVECLLMRTS